MLDGQETVQIAWGELRWEGARQHAGRRGSRANSLRRASLGRSDTACWNDRKPCANSLRKASLGRERDSMLDGEETVEIACGEPRWEGARTACWTREETVQIACGELRWDGAIQHAGRKGNRANSLGRALLGGSETACWTDRKPWK